MSLGKGGAGKQIVDEYSMSMHVGVCHWPNGPDDRLLGISIGEKSAWEGSVQNESTISINLPDLFGGPKKEGGVIGEVRVLPGADTQDLPSGIKNRLPGACPGYRGLLSLFFAKVINGTGGFVWGCNSPYLRTLWFRVKRVPYAFAAAIGEGTSYAAMADNQANPSHMIYECLTDKDWGMGCPPGRINVASFQAAAKTLSQEGFGLSMMWSKQSSVQDFITEIIDHIQAVLFVNPKTGLIEVKLIRDDYDINDLPLLDETNCVVTKFDRKMLSETTNEIVVIWTNPLNEQDETVTLHDLANIAMQGSIVSDSRNYYGIRNATLAMQIAARDLRSAAAPLAALEIEVDRDAWAFIPGGCFRLNYAEHEVLNMVVRVTNINYGKVGDSAIKLTGMEDVFAFAQSQTVTPPATGWEDTPEDPREFDFYRSGTLPYYFVLRMIDQNTSYLYDYPEVLLWNLGAQDSKDTRSFELVMETTDTLGDNNPESQGTLDLAAHATLGAALVKEESSVVSYDDLTRGDGPDIGGFMLIGQELCLITDTGVGTVTVKRGVLDTSIQAHPTVGEEIWFFRPDTRMAVPVIVSDGQQVYYRGLPTTSRGTLPFVGLYGSVFMDDRPYRPYNNKKVVVNGIQYLNDVDVTGLTSMNVTWANRNRLTEDNVVLGWDDDTVSPENLQTTTITLDVVGIIFLTYSGLTGLSQMVDLTTLAPGPGEFRLTMYTEREGFISNVHQVRIYKTA